MTEAERAAAVRAERVRLADIQAGSETDAACRARMARDAADWLKAFEAERDPASIKEDDEAADAAEEARRRGGRGSGGGRR